ncbi:SusC/RagA family TonB-linked outer membrane protein [Arachidicoccus soli]|uniref:SusC/RagA family TonB-linked outer membrane protein n=1 Tax=Arachidicoccus soli TaxID=2341117 RepID=A0A386HQR5_9BACT|nr:SusC/RagA family TonB-linked outer membrane protein [Arachidicoccus soli]AYD48288.1 SusC/RagA family TonB-linked outer membrane protein [Arachidicoccus soli]
MHLYIKITRSLLLSSLAVTLIVSNTNGQVTVPKKNTENKVLRSDSLFVQGVIELASTKARLSGISLSVPDYSAAITDNKGRFKIAVPSYSSVILISGDGFQQKQVALKGRKKVVVSMYEEPYTSQFDVTTLPFGDKPKDFIPYATQSLNADNKWEQSTNETPMTYLQGKIAGLNVIRHSGTPGIGANVTLRGANSLYATNQPLIVVDGVIYDNNEYGNSLITGNMYNPLSDIDVKDIDNITVLKSGNSTYGTKGANGVILITTARAQELATRIDFAAYGGFNLSPNDLPVMQAGDYRTYLSDLLKTTGMTQDEIQKMPYMNDNMSSPNYFRYHNNTDWQKEVMKNSFNNNYYLKVTGGDNIAKYALSLGYLKSQGVLDNTDLTRFQLRFNGDLNLSKKLTAAVNLALVSNQENSQIQGGENILSPLSLSLAKAPFLPVHVIGDDGKISPNLADYDIFNMSNPVAIAQNMQGANKNYRFTGSVKFNYKFNKSLSLQTLLGITFDKVQEDLFIPQSGVVPDTLATAVAYNRSGSNLERYYSLFNDTKLSYAHTFNLVHKLNIDAGFRYQNNKSENEYGLGYNSATDQFVSVGMGVASLRSVGGDIGEWNWLNTYFHAGYSYLDKYFASFNLSSDGSSRFGKQAPDGVNIAGNKWAVNPSLALAWLMSSENFFSNIKFVQNLKLRASYSRVGNDDIGNYTARQYYISQNLLGLEGLVRGNIGNPQLEWETVDKLDLGLDASFLNERLNLSVDLYQNKTYHMITIDPTNSATGINYVIANNGTMSNNGIELSIDGRIINKGFKWDMGLNIAANKNKIDKFPNGKLLTSYADATYLTETGKASNLFYGYKTNGIFSTQAEAAASGLQYQNADGTMSPFQAGDVRFVDVNGDHVINDDDRQVIGNPNPKFFGGFSNTFSWKRWALDAIFTFSEGNDIYNYTRAQLESMSGYGNQSLAVNNRWRSDGQITNIPRVAWGDPAGNARFSDRWIEDGSYLRLRTLSLSYNLPIKASALKYLKVYATGNNLITWTKYLGYDPEFSATNSVFGQGVDIGLEPIYKTVQLGVRLGF